MGHQDAFANVFDQSDCFFKIAVSRHQDSGVESASLGKPNQVEPDEDVYALLGRTWMGTPSKWGQSPIRGSDARRRTDH
jgi:hypothetical protein